MSSNIQAVQTGSGWDVDGPMQVPVFAQLDTTGRPIRTVTADGQVVGGGALTSGTWLSAQVITRLRIVGTGALTVDSRDRAGAVTAGVFSGSYTSTPESIEYVYPGDTGIEIRATFPTTLTVEVI